MLDAIGHLRLQHKPSKQATISLLEVDYHEVYQSKDYMVTHTFTIQLLSIGHHNSQGNPRGQATLSCRKLWVETESIYTIILIPAILA